MPSLAPLRRLSLALGEAFAGKRGYASTSDTRPLAWVFLGPPGVGKGTYATRVADSLGFYSLATGELVRGEIKKKTDIGLKMKECVEQGHLLPDQLILRVLRERFMKMAAEGVDRFLLDGFPRTADQAAALEQIADVQLALNLDLREEVLVEKCLGRRICTQCGKNYNIADIHLPASNGRPEIVMPPLPPLPECEAHLEQRADDTEETILRRLDIYRKSAAPVEDYYMQRGKLVNFEITGGIPETLPRLLRVLKPYEVISSEAMAA